ncbi:MAG TPA: class GN sortase [Thermoanaerobaculia bacterium]|nr:class GN sortase [Thermoanaerobaculia bacterium]
MRTRAQLSAWTLSAAVREANACGRKSIAGFASGLLLLAAAVLFGHGAWIYAKASLAQILLRRAWAKTVDSGRPAAPWPWADTWPIARLRAPGLRGDVIVLAGSSGRTLAFGPGHLSGTALPGEPGNCVLSAHRDTQFAFLKSLIVGDLLELETSDGHRHSYRVYDRRIARETQLDLLETTTDATLTLVTCYPFDAIRPGGPLRYIVRAVSPNPSFALSSNPTFVP